MNNQCAATPTDQDFNRMALFPPHDNCCHENIFALLRIQIYGFHQSAEKASETSMTTTLMVSFHWWPALCAFAVFGRYPAGYARITASRGVGPTNALLLSTRKRSLQTHAPARRATSRMVIIFTALFEFKNAHKCPVSRRLFLSAPCPRGCVKHHRDGNGYSHFVVVNVIQIVI